MKDIITKLDELAELQVTADVTRIDYETKRAEILKAVETELDALDTEFEPLLNLTQERIAQLEAEIRQDVLKHGASVRGNSLHAVYYRGRVSWNTRGLDEYASTHPEIVEFRTQGEPGVQLRVVKPSGANIAPSVRFGEALSKQGGKSGEGGE